MHIDAILVREPRASVPPELDAALDLAGCSHAMPERRVCAQQ